TFPVTGGKQYRFQGPCRARDVAVPRRGVVVKLNWRDDQGKAVVLDEPHVTAYLRDATAMAETEFPVAQGTDAAGWTEMSGTYRAPAKATRAVVELHLQWSPNSEVRWGEAALTEVDPPAPRKARLATVHFQPRGGK